MKFQLTLSISMKKIKNKKTKKLKLKYKMSIIKLHKELKTEESLLVIKVRYLKSEAILNKSSNGLEKTMFSIKELDAHTDLLNTKQGIMYLTLDADSDLTLLLQANTLDRQARSWQLTSPKEKLKELNKMLNKNLLITLNFRSEISKLLILLIHLMS